eukprot:TRINITY_DN19573_c0_g1_i1.p1 TRINITY_DN19573_c0_g1~~TRINITY_DN19573_c0_g1_i1.p1  ORF type:complete len:511 (+),score=49.54 TRINITY_DN19573_c0_g1_i1:78-1535(+)
MRRGAVGSLLCAVLLCAAGAEGKGSAAGARGSTAGRATSRSSPGAYAFAGVAGGVAAGAAYAVGARRYAPAYGGYTHATDPSCTTSHGCPCPTPREDATRAWLWTQVRLPKKLRPTPNAYCASGVECYDGSIDVTTLEVDAFIQLASQDPCNPPTEVLVLKVCALDDLALVTGGLSDDDLSNPSYCTTVGDSESRSGPHYIARARRLLQTEASYNVVQLVVGAESSDGASALVTEVLRAFKPTTQLGRTYAIPDYDSVISVTPDSEADVKAMWAPSGSPVVPPTRHPDTPSPTRHPMPPSSYPTGRPTRYPVPWSMDTGYPSDAWPSPTSYPGDVSQAAESLVDKFGGAVAVAMIMIACVAAVFFIGMWRRCQKMKAAQSTSHTVFAASPTGVPYSEDLGNGRTTPPAPAPGYPIYPPAVLSDPSGGATWGPPPPHFSGVPLAPGPPHHPAEYSVPDNMPQRGVSQLPQPYAQMPGGPQNTDGEL